MLSIFSYASWPSVCLLWRNVCSGLPPILGLGGLSFWYWADEPFVLLEVNPMSVVWLANIFSHSKDCLFIWFMVSFALQKFLSLIRYYLFILLLFSLGGRSKKILLWFMSKGVLPMFSSKSFIITGLMSLSLCMVLDDVLLSFFYM